MTDNGEQTNRTSCDDSCDLNEEVQKMLDLIKAPRDQK